MIVVTSWTQKPMNMASNAGNDDDMICNLSASNYFIVIEWDPINTNVIKHTIFIIICSLSTLLDWTYS